MTRDAGSKQKRLPRPETSTNEHNYSITEESSPHQIEQDSLPSIELPVLRSRMAEQESQIDVLKRVNAEQAETIRRLEKLLHKEKQTLHSDLPENQRVVLQAILDLSDKLPDEEAFREAKRLLSQLEGQPMTEAFAKSLNSVLRQKNWGVLCEKCSRSSLVLWHAGKTYAEGGRGRFSHAGSTPHGTLTTIPKFIFSSRLDHRKRSR
jgi:hypothetical protein